MCRYLLRLIFNNYTQQLQVVNSFRFNEMQLGLNHQTFSETILCRVLSEYLDCCGLLMFRQQKNIYVTVTFVSVFTIEMSKGASSTGARGVLIVNILNKCILSILVYNLFYRQIAQYLHTPQYFHTSVYWLFS
mgnify:CR=1 FL=1